LPSTRILRASCCVQYRESDRNFAQRLLEEEGIYYFFRHEEAGHTLVLADSTAAHKTVDGHESILYRPKERRGAAVEEHFWYLKARAELYPGRTHGAERIRPDKESAQADAIGRATAEDLVTAYPFEHYDHPGGLSDPAEAQREAELRTERLRACTRYLEAEGNTMGLAWEIWCRFAAKTASLAPCGRSRTGTVSI